MKEKVSNYMDIQKEMEYLVYTKYKYIVLDPLSIKSQGLKLLEEFDELEKAKTQEQVECELGDVLFVEKSLQMLFDADAKDCCFYGKKSTSIATLTRGLNKCDKEVLKHIYSKVTKVYEDYIVSYPNNKNETQLLEQTIIKNKGRDGEVINNCYVKKEDA